MARMDENQRLRWFHFGLFAVLTLSAAVIVPVELYWGYKVGAANDRGDPLPISLWVALAAIGIPSIAGWYWLLRKLVQGKDKKDR
jgi:hypothetical protein